MATILACAIISYIIWAFVTNPKSILSGMKDYWNNPKSDAPWEDVFENDDLK